MFESPQRGVLRTKNCKKTRAISIKTLTKTIAGCKQNMIEELIRNGVVRVARKDGALYSKRLIKDELRRRHKAQNGQRGGKQNPSKPQAKPKQTSSKTQAKGGSSTSSSTSPSGLNNSSRRCFKDVTVNESVVVPTYTLEDFLDAGLIVGLTPTEAEACFDFYKGQQFQFKKDFYIKDARDACKRWRNNRQNFAPKQVKADIQTEYEKLKTSGEL